MSYLKRDGLCIHSHTGTDEFKDSLSYIATTVSNGLDLSALNDKIAEGSLLPMLQIHQMPQVPVLRAVKVCQN